MPDNKTRLSKTNSVIKPLLGDSIARKQANADVTQARCSDRTLNSLIRRRCSQARTEQCVCVHGGGVHPA
eukprot:6189505-Pleurochrysis_carterae.AAC.1